MVRMGRRIGEVNLVHSGTGGLVKQTGPGADKQSGGSVNGQPNYGGIPGATGGSCRSNRTSEYPSKTSRQQAGRTARYRDDQPDGTGSEPGASGPDRADTADRRGRRSRREVVSYSRGPRCIRDSWRRTATLRCGCATAKIGPFHRQKAPRVNGSEAARQRPHAHKASMGHPKRRTATAKSAPFANAAKSAAPAEQQTQIPRRRGTLRTPGLARDDNGEMKAVISGRRGRTRRRR